MLTIRSIHTLPLAATLALTAVLAACSKQPEPPAPAPVTDAAPSEDTDREAAERQAREAAEAERRAAEEARRTRASLEEMVFFDYDRSELRGDARSVLDAKLPILRAHPAVRLRIEGHADERGSTEYNLALGMRRATSVKDYLVDFGLDGTRFQALSYGEERPLAPGQNESAWSRNRRAEFIVIQGLPIATPSPSPGPR